MTMCGVVGKDSANGGRESSRWGVHLLVLPDKELKIVVVTTEGAYPKWVTHLAKTPGSS